MASAVRNSYTALTPVSYVKTIRESRRFSAESISFAPAVPANKDLPGKTPNEAFDSYAKPLKAVLSCITREVVLRRTIPRSENEDGFPLQEFFFVRNPVRLRDSPLAFNFSQYFRTVWSGDAYKIKTEAYTYEIEEDSTGHELFAFHWEPNAPNATITVPHMHIGFALRDTTLRIDNKAHIPTGRVPLEDVVAFLISELRVAPLNSDWGEVIKQSRAAFMRYKTW